MAEHERYHVPNRRFNRREMLQKSAALAITSTLPPSFCESTPFDQEKNPQSETLRKIIKFDAEVGDASITAEQAMEYVPLLASLYVETINPISTAEELSSQTYIVPPPDEVELESVFSYEIDFPNDGVPFISPITAHLQHTYPDVQLPLMIGRKIVLTAYDPLPIQGITFTNKDKYIFLGKINDPHIDPPSGTTSSLTAYDEINTRVHCMTASPIVRLRQTVLHEFAHSDIEETEDHTQGYILSTESGGRYDLFEEFFADYTAAEISDKSGLPYTTGYAFEPVDFKNFSEVLKQNDISLRELARMHRYSALIPLMTEISKSPYIDGFDRSEYLAARKRTLRAIFQEYSYTPNWQTLSDYYPEVSPENVIYAMHQTDDANSGCK
jgi:hypothetical protein